ncbi:MAG TPA: hypothetical protein VMG12_13360 [Polyangiaceae bacterium]|nr:hypothetical protein [Polyangiaceae bacterium]
MRRTETERGSLLLSASLWAMGIGCGDIGDAQLPLPIHDGRSREPAREPLPFAAVEVADGTAPQAVMHLSVAGASGAACPIALEALLPDASATVTLVNGRGQRAVAGEHVLISCRVAAQLFSESVFELDAYVQGEHGPLVHAKGRLGPMPLGSVDVQLQTPDGASLGADCPIQASEVLDGAVWFHTTGCRSREHEASAGACDIQLGAIFENCRR